MMEFQKRGFNYKLYENPSYAPDGMELDSKIFCLFEKYDKKFTTDTERADRITINRWSSGSQGHGIDVMIESENENTIIYKGSMKLDEFAKCITAQASCKITTEIE